MGEYELHFAEEGPRPSLCLRLPADWTHKTARNSRAFVETYNKANPPLWALTAPDVRTGRFYADDAPLADADATRRCPCRARSSRGRRGRRRDAEYMR